MREATRSNASNKMRAPDEESAAQTLVENHLMRGSLMLGCACSSFRIMMTAGTTKTAAMINAMSNTTVKRHPRSVGKRRLVSRAGRGGGTFCRGGCGTGACGCVAGIRRGAAGAGGVMFVGKAPGFGDCGCCGRVGAWVVVVRGG